MKKAALYLFLILPAIATQIFAEENYAEDLGEGLKLDMIWVAPGTFQMGSQTISPLEKPPHFVELDGFWIGRTEVTQKQYQQIMGVNPSTQIGDNRPAHNVTWDEAMEFCRRLTQAAGKNYSLPTEAQWERACRAGSDSRWCFGNDLNQAGEYAWHAANAKHVPQLVATRRPNAWNLYDMHGNAAEWCADWFDGAYYSRSPRKNPTGPESGGRRVIRGGSVDASIGWTQSAARSNSLPAERFASIGFRVCRLTLPPAIYASPLIKEAAPGGKPDEKAAGLDGKQAPAPTQTSVPAIYVENANGLGIKMIWIKPGSFQMGSNDGPVYEQPLHTVDLDGFWIGETEVTQRQYGIVMGANPPFTGNKSSYKPVDAVTWGDATEFCKRLSQITGNYYTLPTEAQWECACRAGSTQKWCYGSALKKKGPLGLDEDWFGEYAWYSVNAANATHNVATKLPNAWGLYDMHGHVAEWCLDWYDVNGDYYATSPRRNPTGPETGRDKIVRGGSLFSAPDETRSAARKWASPKTKYGYYGFRLCRLAGPPPTAEKPKTEQTTQKTPLIPPRSERDYAENLEGVNMEMAWIERGSFQMGANTPPRDYYRYDEEQPIHRVELDAFWIGRTEITQAQYAKIMGGNPSYSKGGDYPVDSVTWPDAMEFCRRLSAKTGKQYTLPTEAQWEYACRAGNGGHWCFGDDERLLLEFAWCGESYDKQTRNMTHPAAKKRANAWGLFDMHGNVREWCLDWYDPRYYANSPAKNPQGPPSAQTHVLRGGAWNDPGWHCRSATRFIIGKKEEDKDPSSGFRVCRIP